MRSGNNMIGSGSHSLRSGSGVLNMSLRPGSSTPGEHIKFLCVPSSWFCFVFVSNISLFPDSSTPGKHIKLPCVSPSWICFVFVSNMSLFPSSPTPGTPFKLLWLQVCHVLDPLHYEVLFLPILSHLLVIKVILSNPSLKVSLFLTSPKELNRLS